MCHQYEKVKYREQKHLLMKTGSNLTLSSHELHPKYFQDYISKPKVPYYCKHERM